MTREDGSRSGRRSRILIAIYAAAMTLIAVSFVIQMLGGTCPVP